MKHKKIVWRDDGEAILGPCIFGEVGVLQLKGGSLRVYYGKYGEPQTISNKTVEEVKKDLQKLCDKEIEKWSEQ